ncbi:MAG: sulfite exporter TauE/SafE family protein [Campylobacteraceae bacterium]|nr:sulfite exporter TauE/SafE family protein [Campylobacteraceae bacterium]
MAGIGASFLIIPVFLYYNFNFALVSAYGLIFNLSNTSTASIRHFKQRSIDFKISVPIILVSAIASPIGALMINLIDSKILLLIFSITMIMIGFNILYRIKNSNLKDFKLSWVKRDGIDSQFNNTPIYKIYYYAIIPKYTKKFIFTYFNTKTNSFVKKKIDIVIDSDEVSTQSDLNPKDSTFSIYKNITFGIIFFILLYILLKRRRLVYLLFLILLVVYYFIGTNPLNSIKIPINTQVQILPTKHSTIFYITPRVLYVQKIMTRRNFIKIILPNGKIGWIKEQNASNN